MRTQWFVWVPFLLRSICCPSPSRGLRQLPGYLSWPCCLLLVLARSLTVLCLCPIQVPLALPTRHPLPSAKALASYCACPSRNIPIALVLPMAYHDSFFSLCVQGRAFPGVHSPPPFTHLCPQPCMRAMVILPFPRNSHGQIFHMRAQFPSCALTC